MSDKTLETAKKVISTCMAVKSHEKLLIITDAGKFDIAHIFADAARDLDLQTFLVEGNIQHSGEPQQIVCAALEKADVCLMITSGSFTHTKARKAATMRGCRIASMPTITKKIVDNALNVNFTEIEKMSTILASLFTKANKIRLNTSLGTDLLLNIEGRTGIPDTGILNKKGAFGNLPAGESMIAPVEGIGDGIVYIDGVISGIGIVDEPVKLIIEQGQIVSIENDDGKLSDFLKLYDENIDKIAEFGVGTNKFAKIINNPLCDEKVYSTVHLGFGNNIFMGGKQNCNMHFDMIIKQPTVYLDEKCIIDDGTHIYG